MTAPTTFRAGDSVTWTEDLAAYPASSGWVLKYKLLFASGTASTFQASASGDAHIVTIAKTTTAAWTAGAATLVSWVEKGSDRITLDQQSVTIHPDLAVATTFDGRSQAVKALVDAKSALAGYVAGGQGHVAEYEISGRRMKFRSADEIVALIDHYEREVAAERALSAVLQGASPGRVYVRF